MESRMFLYAKGRLKRLEALNDELKDLLLEARHRRDYEEARELVERQRLVYRATLILKEFGSAGPVHETVTIQDVLAKYS